METSSRISNQAASTANRLAWIFIGWLPFVSVLHGEPPVQVGPREWSDVSGQFSLTATLTDADEFQVALTKETGEAIKVPRRRLAEQDDDYIQAVESVAATLAAIQNINTLMEKLGTELEQLEVKAASARGSGSSGEIRRAGVPDAVTAQAIMRHHQLIDDTATHFKALHNESKDAISGFLSGTLLAIGKDARSGAIGQLSPVATDQRKLKEAEKYLEEGLDRLRRIRKHLPDYYTMALVSALNNRTVLALKRGQNSKAAALLAEAAEIDADMQLAIIHNTAILLSLSSHKNPLFKLGTAQQQRLQASVAELASRDPDPGLPMRFFYSTACEGSNRQPSLQAQGQALPDSLRQLELWPELTCFLCSGSGYLDCGRCVKGVTSFRQRQQVGVNHLNEPVFAEVVQRRKCGPCSAAGVIKCKQCSHGQISLRD